MHQITSACSRGEFSFCGCDTSRNGITTPLGWQWGSCSDNISFGIEYAQNFLDVREIEIDQSNVSQVENSMVHLHNNAVGRRVREREREREGGGGRIVITKSSGDYLSPCIRAEHLAVWIGCILGNIGRGRF